MSVNPFTISGLDAISRKWRDRQSPTVIVFIWFSPIERAGIVADAEEPALVAKRLDELRKAWFNPPDMIDVIAEVVPDYPDRIVPKDEKAAAELKKRTLTKLYNARPQWLADAHGDLDAAVAAAYGWPADISDEAALGHLLAMNLARASTAKSNDVDEEDDNLLAAAP